LYLWGSGTLGKYQVLSLIDKWLDNPSDNADMSNEKGDLKIIISRQCRDNLLLK
jgi:hypothetical protein